MILFTAGGVRFAVEASEVEEIRDGEDRGAIHRLKGTEPIDFALQVGLGAGRWSVSWCSSRAIVPGRHRSGAHDEFAQSGAAAGAVPGSRAPVVSRPVVAGERSDSARKNRVLAQAAAPPGRRDRLSDRAMNDTTAIRDLSPG